MGVVSKDEVKRIAHLARIYLDEKEVNLFTKNLEDILRYMAKLEKLNIKDAKPTTHVLPLKNVYRQDIVKPSLKQHDVMKMAVFTYNGSFKVPQVIE